jgi:hypothetical protein
MKHAAFDITCTRAMIGCVEDMIKRHFEYIRDFLGIRLQREPRLHKANNRYDMKARKD